MDSVTVRSLSTGSPIIDPSAILLAGSRVIGDVIVGKDASIWYNTVIRGDFGQITIGDRTNIQDNSMIHVTGGDYDTFIGNDVLIGHSCIIHGCRLHDFAYVGLGAIVLDGAEIEPTGMLAGGAMLTPNKRIREGELWAGRPAKFVRRLEEHEIEVNKSGISLYLEMSRRHAQAKDVVAK